MWQNCVLTLSLTLPYLRISINHIHEDNRRFLLIGGKTVKIGNICDQPLLSFTFDLQRYQNLSLTECVSPHHYLFNILKVTASWTKDRITSDSLMATLHTSHCSSLLTAATRRTGRHCASRERSGSPGSGERVSWLRIRTPRHRQMLTISHQHSGVRTRAGRACSSALLDILYYYITHWCRPETR